MRWDETGNATKKQGDRNRNGGGWGRGWTGSSKTNEQAGRKRRTKPKAYNEGQAQIEMK